MSRALKAERYPYVLYKRISREKNKNERYWTTVALLLQAVVVQGYRWSDADRIESRKADDELT